MTGPSRSKMTNAKRQREYEERGGEVADFFSEPTSESKGLLTDALKKVLTAGVGAAFMTEDMIRNYLSELKLPKEILNLLIQGASKSKDEITHRVSKEVVQLLKKVDFAKEISRFAEGHKFKITAEIEILKKEKKKS